MNFKNITTKKYKNKIIKYSYDKSSNIKCYIFAIIFIGIFIFIMHLKNCFFELNKNYLKTQNNIKIKFLNEIKNKIKFAIYIEKIKRGGNAKVTSLFLKYFHEFKVIDIYLCTLEIEEEEDFIIPIIIRRIFLKNNEIYNLIRKLKKKKLKFLYINILEVER